MLLRQKHSVRICVIDSRVSFPLSSQACACSFDIKSSCVSLLRPIPNLVHNFRNGDWHMVVCDLQTLSVISHSVFDCVALYFALNFYLYVFLVDTLGSLMVCSSCVLSARVLACTANISAVSFPCNPM